MFPKNKPVRNEQYLDFIRSKPCCVCTPKAHESDTKHSAYHNDPHHWGTTGKGMGVKCSDFETVPLCRYHHNQLNAIGGSQRILQAKFHIDFETISEAYNKKWLTEQSI